MDTGEQLVTLKDFAKRGTVITILALLVSLGLGVFGLLALDRLPKLTFWPNDTTHGVYPHPRSHSPMPHRIRLLIVDDETSFLETLSKRLSLRGFAIASRTRVCDAMVPVVESIDEDAQVCHAIAEMVCSQIQSILVTRDDVVVGILRLSDVFEEVADVIRNHPAVT